MTAVTIARQIEAFAKIAGEVAGAADSIAPYAMIVAGLFPGAASVLAGLQVAEPIIKKIAQIAPAAVQAIETGMPILAAFDKTPELMPELKNLYSVLSAADPTVPTMAPSEITDRQAVILAGPLLIGRQWTSDELERWWDKPGSAHT